ncbi:MAG: c-type cytochrome [Candidatus Hydrogenedentes bacterium]|nr:c-type cytochrome [Candidatus Hydrogenedentota bacterium]
MRFRISFYALFAFALIAARAHDANRLAYLDDQNPFYPSRDFPKLITPQWIGEPGVDAAIILSIDDMRDPKKYEAYLRPIINKLKELYGTASMSIMACNVDPNDPQLQTWLAEGLSIEVHTVAHPCPLLGRGQFDEARATFESCISLMSNIPGNKPVAFRMPCCDSINSTSPRFFYEIFAKPTPGAPHLAIDSSVFNITTANDPALPRAWVIREDGRERFRSYLPFPSFKTTIEDYPYPYIIGNGIWEFPCAVPSDWEAQNINKPNNPQSLTDMKVSLDAAVAKKGVYTLVFHPHGWIESKQIVELVEHAAKTYGNRAKFLSFAEAYRRLRTNAVGVTPRDDARSPISVHLLDINNDGYMDTVSKRLMESESWNYVDINVDGEAELIQIFYRPEGRNASAGPTPITVHRVWDSGENRWRVIQAPIYNEVRYGIDADGMMFAAHLSREHDNVAWRFEHGSWTLASTLTKGLRVDQMRIPDESSDHFTIRFRDIDGNGAPELIYRDESRGAVFTRTSVKRRWKRLPFKLPGEDFTTESNDEDDGLRLIDVDGDHDLDVLLSNQDSYAVYLFDSMKTGWSTTAISGKRDGSDPATAVPPIAINGENNGAWFHSRSLWVQNEHTDKLPDLVDRRAFNDLTASVEPKPKSPEAGLASISVRPGLRVELVAAEPLVVDPVSIAWGPDGKLWVVEMRDYPLGMDGEGKPGSRVKFLEDLDSDGKYDKATVFLDKLNFATGVMPWRDGVLVTAAPQIIFAKDTNADGNADTQEVLYEGFVQGNQQHRINGLRWGLDNWFHCANGDSGGKIISNKTGEAMDISGRDLRIQPDTGAMDAESGMTQFGIAFDDWGSRFGCANWLPVWHYALDDRYMRRNPHFSPGNPREYVVEQAALYPTSKTLTRFNDFEHVNRSTSTCGIEIYRDSVLGPEFYGNAFVCEPVHDLVLRTVLEPNGATFSGHRAPGEEQSEFLSSHDNWFRPVQVRTGPDGALYVVDMYRQVIEHPEYISKETQAKLNLRAGDDKGRIYRVVPVRGRLHAVENLTKLSTQELVNYLNTPNCTLRDMVHQILIERGDSAAIPYLRNLIQKRPGLGDTTDLEQDFYPASMDHSDVEQIHNPPAKFASPQACLHALYLLEGLHAITSDDILTSLSDRVAGVRRNAVRIAALYLNEMPDVAAAVEKLKDDPDAFLRMEVVCALGEWRDPRSATALAQRIEKDNSDSYLGMALLSSINASNVRALTPSLLNWAATDDAAAEPREQVLSTAVGVAIAANDAETLAVMATDIAGRDQQTYDPKKFSSLATFLDALKSKDATLDALGIGTVADSARAQIAAMLGAARNTVVDSAAEESVRAAATHTLCKEATQREADIALLGGLLSADTPDNLRAASLGTLLDTDSDAVPAIVLAAWPNISADARPSVLDAMQRRETWLAALMTALEAGTPSFRELDAAHRQDLLTSKNDDIRARAEKLMAGAANPDRQAVIEQYKEAATIPGQFLRGRGIFRERCASCHQLGTAGHAVGPDLTALTDRSPEAVLVSILDPNRAVETKFFNYVVETKDLSSYSGILAEESGNSVKIRGANGIENTILRSDIDAMTSESRSPMPDGLEDGLTPEDVANLIAYILDTRPKE